MVKLVAIALPPQQHAVYQPIDSGRTFGDRQQDRQPDVLCFLAPHAYLQLQRDLDQLEPPVLIRLYTGGKATQQMTACGIRLLTSQNHCVHDLFPLLKTPHNQPTISVVACPSSGQHGLHITRQDADIKDFHPDLLPKDAHSLYKSALDP